MAFHLQNRWFHLGGIKHFLKALRFKVAPVYAFTLPSRTDFPCFFMLPCNLRTADAKAANQYSRYQVFLASFDGIACFSSPYSLDHNFDVIHISSFLSMPLFFTATNASFILICMRRVNMAITDFKASSKLSQSYRHLLPNIHLSQTAVSCSRH